jgi:hypothetical protein
MIVRPGEWWAIGEHRFLCGDLTTPHGEDVLTVAGQVDAVYTDPPWGKGEARRFRTLSGVDGGQAKPVDWPAFAGRMVELWAHCVGDVWVAMSPLSPVLDQVREHGGSLVGQWAANFQGRRCDLLRLRFQRGPLTPVGNLVGVEVWGQADRVLYGLPLGATVVDWCFGLGSTPLACVQGGWRFVGSELGPTRMARTLDSVAAITGVAPVRWTV